jgi:hypothetical protein
MQLTGLDLVFWAAGFLGHLVLLLVLLVRRRAKDFPFFTTLIASNLLRTVTLYLTLHHGTKSEYFYTYWSLAVVDMGLQLCVVYELASDVFRPLGDWVPEIRKSLAWLITFSVAIASALTCLSTPATHVWVRAIVIKGNFFSSALMSELFVGMVALSATVGLPWKTHVARISQGLGVYSIIGVLTEAGHSTFGTNSRIFATLSHLRITTYLICIGYWIVMLWQEAPAPRQLPEDMRGQLFTLQRRVEFDLQRLRAWRRE